jgi:hypothetical protein
VTGHASIFENRLASSSLPDRVHAVGHCPCLAGVGVQRGPPDQPVGEQRAPTATPNGCARRTPNPPRPAKEDSDFFRHTLIGQTSFLA